MESAASSPLEERRLRFEAKRFALETYVKVYLEQMQGSRLLLVSHSRMMFTLSLGALAGIVTLFAAALRFGSDRMLQSAPPPAEIALAVVSLGFLVGGALLATGALRAAALAALVRQTLPYPPAQLELDGLLPGASRDEEAILRNLAAILNAQCEHGAAHRPRTSAIALCLILGLASSCLVLFWQWGTP